MVDAALTNRYFMRLLLLAVFPLVGVSQPARQCLPAAVPLGSRKTIMGGGPVKMVTYSWECSKILGNISKIILEEHMGFRVELGKVVGGSHLGPPALAGGQTCVADDGFQNCDVDNPDGHFIMDSWEGGRKSYDKMSTNIRPQMLEMGYLGSEGTFVPDVALASGLSASPPVFLDFYKSFNASAINLTRFLAPYAEVETKIKDLNLAKADCSRQALPQAHQGCVYYEKFTGDKKMYTWSGHGSNMTCHLDCKDHWIRSPACRRDPDRCVAWISTGDGWGVEEMMQQAYFWNIALAIAVLPAWRDYKLLPLRSRTLWYWSTPDPTFMALSPTRLMEPLTNSEERRKRHFRTGAKLITMRKFIWKNLGAVAPEPHALLSQADFTQNDVTMMMKNVSLGQKLEEIACRWVVQNKARWELWVPSPLQCPPGHACLNHTYRYLCPRGFFNTGASNTCTVCGIGKYQGEAGSAVCKKCFQGQFQDLQGQSACRSCPPGFSGPEKCEFQVTQGVLGSVFIATVTVAVHLLGMVFSLNIWGRHINDACATRCEDNVETVNATSMISTAASVRLSNQTRTFNIFFLGTNQHDFDSAPFMSLTCIQSTRLTLCKKLPCLTLKAGGRKMFIGRQIGRNKFQLISNVDGSPLRHPLITSVGTLHFSLSACVAMSWRCFIMSFILVSIGVVCSQLLFSNASQTLFWGISTLLGVITMIIRLLQQKRPQIWRKHQEYRRQIRKHSPRPNACEPGAGRAIALYQILKFFETFQAFIGERNMYYVDPSIIRPVTMDDQLSLAEFVGPCSVTFFISHFWGSPFRHFVQTINSHAQSVDVVVHDDSGNRVPSRSKDISGIGYWVCLFSNNQWRLEDEVPANDWKRSSFYLALMDPGCRGAVMVLDSEALPLTRSWCLFEVLQSLKLKETGRKFCFVLATESGVLNMGNGSYDTAASLGKRLMHLKVEDGMATRVDDKNMIDRLIMESGGFDRMNTFIKSKMKSALGKISDRCGAEFSDLIEFLDTKEKLFLDTREKSKSFSRCSEEEGDIEERDATSNSRIVPKGKQTTIGMGPHIEFAPVALPRSIRIDDVHWACLEGP